MKEEQLASRLDRFIAIFVDMVVIAVLCGPILYYAGLVDFTEVPQNEVYFPEKDPVKDAITTLIFLAIFFVVNFQYLRNDGQTVGKRGRKIKIVHMDGEKASMVSIVKRYAFFMLIPAIPYGGDVISLIDALLIFAATQRCGHDLIAGTKVVCATQPSEDAS